MKETEDFVAGDSRTNMLEPGTRIMLFQEEGYWLAVAVDSSSCVQGKTIDELKQHWLLTVEAYEEISVDIKNWWEPPKPFEYEPVWLAGTPCDFIDGLEARVVDYQMYCKASDVYHKRYKSLVFGLTEEEQVEFDAKKS